jgi:effector-binding domain-containing protein
MAESPKYTVIRKENQIEIRQYFGYIQAEVNIHGSTYKTAIEDGFDILAGYIFGNNTSRQKVDMTTPVKVNQSEKIAMTTPVTVKGDDEFTVAFIMPSEYSLSTLPVPRDERIRFIPISAHKMATIRFSGFFNQENIQKNKERLREWMAETGLEGDGDFIVAGYNPPWIPGFLARNEVMIKVKDESQKK